MKNKENPSATPNDTGNTSAAKKGTSNPSNTRIRVEEHGMENPVGTKSLNPTGNGI